MSLEQDIFSRTERLVGEETMDRIANSKVIIFGVGGVGSWCVEGLIRSGIRHLTMVDSDLVSVTNINRQLPATTKTVGHVKVEVLKQRMLEINPEAEIVALQKIYSKDTYQEFELDKYDYIIDAIDSLENKVHLIQTATKTSATFFSSMGAALKLDSTKIEVSEFWKVRGCPLAAALRRRLKKSEMPSKKFLCVYSEEVLENKGLGLVTTEENIESSIVRGDPELALNDWNEKKAQINGTLVHATAIFGFTLSGLVVQDIIRKSN
ncbi:ThiF family adenylyltransferase [Dysgonomonas sp. 520]|uniref:tRNA threonylcarbamoyladenosine dehydratase n=1 Tax=Dysgonomonas sp. 520 TaxID=2302931 RepID=UPI0013CFC7DB|nr:tRNA threonylcarbamoyladenosine dehydratase [Dysgonomonas sp. 520]NDW09941.1 tRNA threonylcarbamoyladenosine dehydratase [Dysgonomonas sp. 520]